MTGALLAFAAGCLALSACDDDKEEKLPQGEPKISYYVVGTVTDTEGAPLPNITMSVKEDYMNRFGYVLMSSTKTDNQGKYQTEVFTDATIHKGLVVMTEDPSGTFLSDTLDLTVLPKKNVLVGDDLLDNGTWELTGDFVLKLRP